METQPLSLPDRNGKSNGLSSTSNIIDKISPLNEIGWLSNCSAGLQNWFAKHARWMDVPAGKTVFYSSDKTDGMFGIGSGAATVEFALNNVEEVLMLRLPPGTWVGETSILENVKRPISLSFPVPSRVLFVSKRKIRSLLRSDPAYWSEFYRHAIDSKIAMLSFIGEMHLLSPEARLARQLLRLSSTSSIVEASQVSLAKSISLSRTHLRRALTTLIEMGSVKTGYNSIEILDREKLESISCRSRDWR